MCDLPLFNFYLLQPFTALKDLHLTVRRHSSVGQALLTAETRAQHEALESFRQSRVVQALAELVAKYQTFQSARQSRVVQALVEVLTEDEQRDAVWQARVV